MKKDASGTLFLVAVGRLIGEVENKRKVSSAGVYVALRPDE
jgi:hypothetical protein